MVGLAMLAVGGVRPAAADIRSDQAAAILEWPSVLFGEEEFIVTGLFEVVDTVIQLTNTSTDPVSVWCFYENANSHCSNTGEVCTFAAECCLSPSMGCGICLPGWNETDFTIHLTPRQPIGWLASQGLAGFQDEFDIMGDFPPKNFGVFPIGGVTRFGINLSTNAGSRIPPVPESPFNGSLRCIAVDEDGIPVDRNVLKGESTLEVMADGEGPDDDFDVVSVAKHNAIGVQAIEGAVNDDNILVLGGPEPEYNGCPNILILNHFFDFAVNPAIAQLNGASGSGSAAGLPITDGIFTAITFVPCTQDYLRQIPGAAVVQFLVYNEFEQRFSTSIPIFCKEVTLLSLIDTTQPDRSIFSAGVAGTLTGQTRINPLGSGLFAVATEIHDGFGLAEFNVHYQGDREAPDLITLP
jgi:hypothetical protein